MFENSPSGKSQRRAKWILPIGILAISSASILIKICDAPPLIIAAYRLTLASLLLSLPALPQIFRSLAAFTRVEIFLWFSAGGFLCAHFALWITSLKYTSVASSVVLVTTNPIFVALASILFLRERLSNLLWLSIFTAVLGAIIIAWGDWSTASDALYGDLLALLGAVAMSGYLLVGRRIRRKMDLHVYISLVYGIAGLFLVLIALANGNSFVGYSPTTYLIFFLLAAIPQMIGHTAVNWALRFFTATLVAVVLLGEPLAATLLAYLFLGEGVRPTLFLGGSLVLLGIYLCVREETRWG